MPKRMNPDEVQGGDLAVMLGVSTRQLAKLSDSGICKRGKTASCYLLKESVRGYVENLRTRKSGKAGTYDAAKLKEKEAKARLAEIQADEKEGKLIDVDTISAANGAILTAFTGRLANFGDGLSSICHNQPGDFVANRVNEGLRSMLRELAKLPYVTKDK